VGGFYRTAAGAEVDLVLELPGGRRWAIEIKRSVTAKPSRGFYQSLDDLKPDRSIIVHSGTDAYAMSNRVEVMGFVELSRELMRM
jgi:predicted AAA+ superfamily ATPase